MSMKINTPFYGNYVDGLRADSDRAPALAQQLVSHAPTDLDSKGRRALAVVDAVGREVHQVRNERTGFTSPRVGGLRNSLLSAFTATYTALTSKADLGGDEAERIVELRDRYFAETRTTRPDAMHLWTIVTGALARITAEGTLGELESFIGPAYLTTVRARADELAAAIGIGSSVEDAPDSTAMRDALYRFSRATSKYCRVLAADVDEDDAESVARFMRAVSPIDEYRAVVRSSGGSVVTDEDEDEGEQPVTPVTPVAPAPTPTPSGGDTPAA